MEYSDLAPMHRGSCSSFDLLDSALVASGVRDLAELEVHKDKAAHLKEMFLDEVGLSTLLKAGLGLPDEARAQALFRWLWRTKPRRYRPGGPFLLTQVLEAQLDPTQEVVGNCLGLTLLFNVLALALGLRAGAVHLEEAWADRSAHVLSLLYLEARTLDVENSLPQGFDYREFLESPGREVWGSRELVADVYLSQGNLHFQRGETEAAVEAYDKALGLNPRYTKAYLNKGSALALLGREEEARRCFDQAPL